MILSALKPEYQSLYAKMEKVEEANWSKRLNILPFILLVIFISCLTTYKNEKKDFQREIDIYNKLIELNKEINSFSHLWIALELMLAETGFLPSTA